MSASNTNRKRRASACDEAPNASFRNPYMKKTPTNITPTNSLVDDSRRNREILKMSEQGQHQYEQPLDQVQQRQLPKQQRRVDQMIILRDSKRQRMTELFDELQAMKNQKKELDKMISLKEKNMEELEKELMKLDDDIEEISDGLQKQHELQSTNELRHEQEPQSPSRQSETTNCHQAQEQPRETLPPNQLALSSPLPQQLTMNPDEHLADPLTATQNMTQTQVFEEEFLTDPTMTASTQPFQHSSQHPAEAVVDSLDKQRRTHDEPQLTEGPGWTAPLLTDQEQEPPSPFQASHCAGTNGILPRLNLVVATATTKKAPANLSSSGPFEGERVPLSGGTSKKRRVSVGMSTLDGYFTSTGPPKTGRYSTGTATTAASTVEPTDLTMDDDDNDDFSDVGNMRTYIQPDNVATQPISAALPTPATSQQHINNDPSAFAPWSREQVSSVLEQRFQIQNFRDKQAAIVQSTLRGRDVFVIMRTGGGM